MIEASGLTRRFGGREVVKDVSFRVEPGEVVGFLGPNGAGKTTTIRMLLGLLRPHAGTASAATGDGAAAGRVGYLPEVPALYPGLTVDGNLRFFGRLVGVGRRDLDPVMDTVRIGDLRRRPVGRLSKGQRQRVALAVALLGSPPAYILDEPTAGLDPRQVAETRRLVRTLAGDGAAVLLSTHILAEAAAACDRVVVIANGVVVAEERPGEAGELEARFLRLVAEAELS